MTTLLNVLSRVMTGVSVASLSLAVVLLASSPGKAATCDALPPVCVTNADGDGCDNATKGQPCDTGSGCKCGSTWRESCTCRETTGCAPVCGE